MVDRVVFRRAARIEFEDASAWYEKQLAGLGHEYVEEIDRTVARICAAPDHFPIAFMDVRRAVVRRFPTRCTSAFDEKRWWYWLSFTAGAIRGHGNAARSGDAGIAGFS